MNKAGCSALLALMLAGCSMPFPLFQQTESIDTKANQKAPHMSLHDWVQLSDKMMASNDGQRRLALNQLKNKPLEQAIWLSHPKASQHERTQAQTLFKKNLPSLDTNSQSFLAVFQAYNEALLQQQRYLAERQQHINNLTRKLDELANIDQQINERKFRE
ncbi:hypothetical protein [Oceanisphaera pacifica]|uniref:Uncharacterized protein n=1 Tax=Oceanisphaera pacifica TaxID=2818389 RepID=A0ABS3NFZ9_9GAMM|nr:hypothetical protein [Oceanisphaera pacifica]MBO1519225.1 hypothetical protein [Oceanisphaera pacifica]